MFNKYIGSDFNDFFAKNSNIVQEIIEIREEFVLQEKVNKIFQDMINYQESNPITPDMF